MHELPVAERILDAVLEHASGHDVSRIVVIHLRVGNLSDLEDEWLQRYFDYLSRGTLAEEARIKIERAPIVIRCDACSGEFEIERAGIGTSECPDCGETRGELVSGREYFVKNMEVV
jgi:hydrogenase nickel incorporation protein HypA/HybF